MNETRVVPMIYVFVGIVVVVLLIGAVMLRRKSDKRGMSYAPDPNIRPGGGPGARPGPGAVAEVAVPIDEVSTEEIAHDEFVSDVTDDLLDPHNPEHAAWVKEHPEMESDDEWVAEHPDDSPS